MTLGTKTRPLETGSRIPRLGADVVSTILGSHSFIPLLFSQLTDDYCGPRLPASYVSIASSLSIIFSTDRSVAHRGYRVAYALMRLNVATGERLINITATPTGAITPPNYPVHSHSSLHFSTLPGSCTSRHALCSLSQTGKAEAGRYRWELRIPDGHTLVYSLKARYFPCHPGQSETLTLSQASSAHSHTFNLCNRPFSAQVRTMIRAEDERTVGKRTCVPVSNAGT